MQPSVYEKKGTFADELFHDIRQLAVGYYRMPFRFFLLLAGTVGIGKTGCQGNVGILLPTFQDLYFGVLSDITN